MGKIPVSYDWSYNEVLKFIFEKFIEDKYLLQIPVFLGNICWKPSFHSHLQVKEYLSNTKTLESIPCIWWNEQLLHAALITQKITILNCNITLWSAKLSNLEVTEKYIEPFTGLSFVTLMIWHLSLHFYELMIWKLMTSCK